MKYRSWLLVVAASLAALSVHGSAAAQLRHTVDDQELRDVRAASPAAADAYLQAEARLRVGDWAGAERLLASARALQPNSFLLARRDCQALTQLGQHNQAVAACKVALSGLTAMDQRAYVGALMSGPDLAKPKNLADAVKEAAHARNFAGQPFADAAFCEIAQHIGDDALYTSCMAGLEANAPGYFETARWRAARPGAPAWLYWLGWSLLVTFAVLTLGQSFLRWFRAPAPRATKPSNATLVVLAFGAFCAHSAEAAEVHLQLSHFRINFDDPESQIPSIAERNADPLEFGYFIQDLAAEAVFYERKKDYATAVKFWRASAKAVPDEAVAFSRACQNYQLLGERDNALTYCSQALNLRGVTSADYVRFGELTVQTPAPLSSEIEDLNAAIAHLTKQENGSGPAAVIECELGVKLEDEAKLAHCTSVLAKTTPNDPHTLTFEWSLAMKRKNYGEARRLVDAMGKTSMPPDTLTQIRTATAEASAWWRRPFTDPRYGLALVVVLGLGAILIFRKRAQLRSATPGAGLSAGT